MRLLIAAAFLVAQAAAAHCFPGASRQHKTPAAPTGVRIDNKSVDDFLKRLLAAFPT